MSTPVDTPFVRRNNGNFSVASANDIQGGAQTVPDTATRDAILPNLRLAGMLVYVTANTTTYQLGNDLVTWSVFTGGGGGGGLPNFSTSQNEFLRVNQNGTAVLWVTLTQDMIAPAWSLSLNGPASPVELGTTIVDPAFTASYNRPAVAATLDDGGGPLTLVTPFTAFAYDGSGPLPVRSYQRTAINAVVTWTLAGNESGGATKTTATSVQWQARAFWGTSVIPGSYNQAFITGLSGNALEAAFARTIAFGAGGGTQHLFYAFPTSLGTPTVFRDVNTGFGVPFSRVATAVAVTNGLGVVVPGGYDIWMSDNPLNAAVTVQIS
jgi:hypothetical protein